MADDKKILVVEDDDDCRNALCAILEAIGFSPLPFASGAETLAGIKGNDISLALLDIMMPEMSGYDLLEKIKLIPEFANIPVIMVTAKDTDSEILTGYQSGADYYITKPFTSKQIEYGIKLFLEAGSD